MKVGISAQGRRRTAAAVTSRLNAITSSTTIAREKKEKNRKT
jgi:hypothetical protein